jgi:hypothetical protein
VPPLLKSAFARLIDPYLAMPIHWRWAAWFTSYAVAVLLALWTRSFVAALAVWILLPFVIPKVWAAFRSGIHLAGGRK